MPVLRPPGLIHRLASLPVWAMMVSLHSAVAFADDAPAAASAPDETEPAQEQAAPGQAGVSAAYDVLIKEAVREFDLGHWGEAVTLFSKANELYPNARALRGLGLAAFENRSYVQAVRSLQAALAHEQKPLTGEQRTSVMNVLSRALAFTVAVEVEREPHNAELLVNGSPAEFDEKGRLLLNPGDYEVIAQAPGYAPVSHKVSARSGQAPARVEFRLKPLAESVDEPVASAAPPAASAEAAPAEAPASEQHLTPALMFPPSQSGGGADGLAIAGYVGLSLAGAGLVAGTVAGVLASSKKGELDDRCDGNVCDFSDRATRDAGQTLATIADISLLVATVSAIGGLVALLASGDDEQAPPSSPVWTTVKAAVGPTSVALSGTF